MEAWKPALVECLRYFSSKLSDLSEVKNTAFIKKMFLELSPEWEGGFTWNDLLDFTRVAYPEFDVTSNTDDFDVVVLSLLVFHGLIVKSCAPFMKHACHMEPLQQNLIMNFLDSTLCISHKVTVEEIKKVIKKLDPGNSTDLASTPTTPSSLPPNVTPLRDFLNSPAARKWKKEPRGQDVTLLREHLYEERNENEALRKEIDSLKQDIKSKDDLLAERRRDVEYLNEELTQTQREIEDLKAHETKFGITLTEKDAKISELIEIVHNLEADILLTKKNMDSKDAEISILQKERNKLRSITARNDEEIDALRKKTDEYWAKTSELMDRCASLQRQLDEAECLSPYMKMAKAESSESTLAAEMASSLLGEKVAELEDLERRLESACEENENLQKALASVQKMFNEQVEKTNDLERKHAELGLDFKNTLKKFATELQAEHNSKETLRVAFDAEKKELMDRIAELVTLSQEKECNLRIQRTQFDLEKSQVEKHLETVTEEKISLLTRVESDQHLLVEKDRVIAEKEAEIMKNGKIIKKKDSIISKKDAELSEKVMIIESKDQVIQEKEIDISAKAASISQLKSVVSTMSDTVSQLKADLSEKTRIIESQNQIIQEKEADISEKAATISQLESVVSTKSSTVSQLEADLSEKARIIECKDQVIQENEADISAKAATISRLESVVSIKSSTVSQLEADLSEKARIIESKDQIIQVKEAEISARAATILQLESVVSIKSSTVSQLEADLSEKARIIESKDQLILEKEADISAKAATISQLESVVSTKSSTVSQLEADLSEKARIIESKDQVIQEKEADISEKAATILQLESAVFTKSGTVTQLEADLLEKSRIILSKDQIIQEKEADISEMVATISQLESVVSTKSGAVTQLEADLAEKSRIIESKDQVIKEKEADISAMAATISQLESAVFTKSSTVTQLEADLAEKSRIIESKDQVIQEKEADISAMAETISHLESVVSTMSGTVTQLEADLFEKAEIIESKDHVIQEKEAEMIVMAETIQNQDGLIAKKNDYITVKDDLIEEKNCIISNKERIIEDLTATSLKKDVIIKEKDDVIAQNLCLISNLEQELEDAKAEVGQSLDAQSLMWKQMNTVTSVKLSLETKMSELQKERAELEELLSLVIVESVVPSSENNRVSLSKLGQLCCNEIQNLREKLSASRSEIETFKAEKVALEHSNKELTGAMEKTNAGLQDYYEKVQKMIEVVSEKDSVIDEHVKQREELLKRLEASITAGRDLESEIVDLRQKLVDLGRAKSSNEEKLNSYLEKEKARSALQRSLDSVTKHQKSEVQNHLARLRSWLDKVTNSCDSLTRSLPATCPAACEVNATKRDIEQMLRSVDDKYINCLNLTIRCSDDILKLTVQCEDPNGSLQAVPDDKEQLESDLSAVRNLMTELVGDVRDVISRCKFLVDRCEFFMDEQSRQVVKVKTSLSTDSPDKVGTEEVAANAVIKTEVVDSGTHDQGDVHVKVEGDTEKKYKSLQAAHTDLKASYKTLEAKLEELQQASSLKTDDNVQSLHQHYAAKLETLKLKMDQICTAEINKVKEEQERSDKELTAKYEKKIAEFKKHVQSQTSQIWELNDRLICMEQEKKRLEDKLLKRFGDDKAQAFRMSQNSRHSLSVDWLDRIGQDDVPLINRARPDRQSLRPEPPAKPKRGQLMSRIEEVAPVPQRPAANASSSSTGVMAPASMGVAFPEEDEDGELFNNTYLADMTSGRTRLNEFQLRNSMCPPHLKSSYPGETQSYDPKLVNEDEIKVSHGDSRRHTKDRSQTSYKRPGPPTPSKNGRRLSLQGKDELKQMTPRGVLQEPNRQSSGGIINILRSGKTTPSRLRALFTSSKVGAVQGVAGQPPLNIKTDENEAPLTPSSKRISIFQKRFGLKEGSSLSSYR